MSTRRHGPCSGMPVRTLLSGKRVHLSGAGRGDGDNRCTAWDLSRTALQRRWTSGGRNFIARRNGRGFYFSRKGETSMGADVMMERIAETSPRLKARITGAFYLLTILPGILREVF